MPSILGTLHTILSSFGQSKPGNLNRQMCALAGCPAPAQHFLLTCIADSVDDILFCIQIYTRTVKFHAIKLIKITINFETTFVGPDRAGPGRAGPGPGLAMLRAGPGP